MPDPRFTKPWHGIPREEIDWHPTIDENACIGCGTCVTGCSRLVYRFDYSKNKAVVADPLNCLVGCTTCANTCPEHAISFPPLDYVAGLLSKAETHHHVEDELVERKEQLFWRDSIPDEEKSKHLIVSSIEKINEKNMIITLRPKTEADCTCQFTPGQYMALRIPDREWTARAYSIGSAPRSDGSFEVDLRRVEGGRFTTWAFEEMKESDELIGIGPMGNFWLKSPPDKPLLFVGRGTGFAPIKAMIEQQIEFNPSRMMMVYWGVTDTSDFFRLEKLQEWKEKNPDMKIVLTARTVSAGFNAPKGIIFRQGTVYDALAKEPTVLKHWDAYVAGPTKTVRAVLDVLKEKEVPEKNIYTDAFGG